MNVLSNVPIPDFPAGLPAGRPPMGADVDTLRLIFGAVVYVLILAGLIYYMVRKLPRGDGSDGTRAG